MKLEFAFMLLNLIQALWFWIIIKKGKFSKIGKIWRVSVLFFGVSCAVMSFRQIVASCPSRGISCILLMADAIVGLQGERALDPLNFILVLMVVENAFLTLKLIDSFRSLIKVDDSPNGSSYII